MGLLPAPGPRLTPLQELLRSDSDQAFASLEKPWLTPGWCLCGQEWDRSLQRVALPVPVSGSLGEEPWEAGGPNNGGQSPVTWQASPQQAWPVVHWCSLLLLGNLCRPPRKGLELLHKHWLPEPERQGRDGNRETLSASGN